MAIDSLCKDPCTGCFTNTPWTAKKESLCQVFIPDGIFKCLGNMLLTYDHIEGRWAVLTCRNNKIIHSCKGKYYVLYEKAARQHIMHCF